MQVTRPRLSGFCPGVRSAENKLFRENKKIAPKPIFAYGHIINNSNYINYLKSFNIRTLDTVSGLPKGSYLALRTHGIDREEEHKLKAKFQVIDLTCVNVKRVQLSIQDHSRRGYFTVITGKKDHPEIKGLVSYTANFTVIETRSDLERFLAGIPGKIKKPGKIFVVSQTTGSKDLFDWTVAGIKNKCGNKMEVAAYNSICPVTEQKEQEALKLQAHVDITFVVGDSLSSNANKLYDILSGPKIPVYFIADLEGLIALKLPLAKYKQALVVSSASTPLFIEEEICRYLEKN
jgi:(E)-4-hydroxy-3-methyl-but-2-enyl pyrophosphate reductase